MLELRTLGTLELTSDAGLPLAPVLAQPRRTALLCYLALGSPRGFRSRDTLYAVFWPEHGAEQARHALRQALYFLRRHLGAAAVVSRGDGSLGVAPDRVRCDAAEFEARLDAGEPEGALALYRGDLLPGFHLGDAPEYEHWLDAERARLRRRATEAAWTLAAARERTGDPAAAAEWGRRAAAFCPTDEMALRRLVGLLERAGDRAAAFQAYEAFASTLAREYELQPSRETQELVAALRADGQRNGAAMLQPAVRPGLELPTGASVHVATERRPGEPAVHSTAAPELPVAPGVGIAGPTAGATAPPPPGELPTPLPAAAVAAVPRRRWSALRSAAALAVGAVLVAAAWLALTRGARDASGVQDEIARTVTRELDVRFGPAAGAAPRLRRTRNVAAYELYRRGSDRSRLRSDSAAWEGMDLLRQAVALDSTYAAAWAELALMSHRVGLTLPPAARERQWEIADAAARRAVALDDSLADGHVMLGKLHMAAFDFAAAERQLTEAVRLDPTLAEPHELMVTLYLWQERPAEALAHAERAVALDPLAAGARAERARALLGVDRCDDALAELDALANLRPPLLRVADIAAHCYARKGMWPAAIAVLRPQAERGLASALAQTAYMLARAGRRDEALRIHAALLGRWRRGEDGAFHVGLVYAGLADLDRAVECFERAVVDRSLHAGHASPGHLWLVLPGPLADDLRRHPGFRRLRARLGRPVRWRGRWQP